MSTALRLPCSVVRIFGVYLVAVGPLVVTGNNPSWLDDHICPRCGYDTGSYGHYTQCKAVTS